MKRIAELSAVLAVLSAAGCDSGGGDLVRTPIFKVVCDADPDKSGYVQIDGKPQTVSFTVMASEGCNASHTASSGFSLSVSSGASGSTGFQVTASSNNSGGDRSDTLKFFFRDELRSKYVIVQEEEQPYIDVSPETFSAGGDATELKVTVSTNQPEYTCEIPEDSKDWISVVSSDMSVTTFGIAENRTGKKRSADIRFASVQHPEVFNYVSVSQGYIVDAPVADLLDVVFAEDGTARDVSAMGMTVTLRADGYVSTQYLEKYGRYAAVFSRTGGPYSKQETGYYVIPYTGNSEFKSKIEDGFSIEMLVCRHDEPGTKQIKPFAATQAGGTGICFRAKTGNEINFEVHTGGKWRELYSGVTPEKGIYYHAIGTWDKATGIANLYVDGELKATLSSATGDFKHLTTNVNAYWFGIGADPDPNDLGEATFNGEVVIARLYSEAISAEQAYSLWREVK